MKNRVINVLDIDNHKSVLGNKTINLKKHMDLGFNVPKFVAIPSTCSQELLSSKVERDQVAKEVDNILACEKYAVRSSALIEDSKKKSFAGQFITKTKVDGEKLSESILKVLKQAKTHLDDSLIEFSIIIQEYIPPDISGVTFTRNPNGNREMIIEYGFCEGEKIMSGEVIPQRISFYWNNELPNNLPKPLLTNQIIEQFKDIEKKNKFPQDIEWCIRHNQFYLLQTRPITTITNKQYEQINFLENTLQGNQKYYYEKTEISEIAPRPTTITLDLLRRIYSEDGPINNVYKKYGVRYKDTKFITIIGNELYVDKEKELVGLLPAYSYLHNNDFSPKLNNYSKIIRVIRNTFFLNKINTKNYVQLFHDLKVKIEEKQKVIDLETAVNTFLVEYELIFETNLLSGLSLKKLDLISKKESMHISDIISNQSLFIDLNKYIINPPDNLRGNSLEVSDESTFISNQHMKNKAEEKVENWWQNIPEYKKKIYRPRIIEAIIYNRLRELGRWLTIKDTNLIRNSLFNYAKEKGMKDNRKIYFASLDDISRDNVDELICTKIKNSYEKYNHLNLPSSITSSVLDKSTELLGVSAGIASGKLQTLEKITKKTISNGNIILYTEMLTPNLTRYFNKITGIVSHNGGLLSHLAIIAREKNIPVVAGFSLNDSKIEIGDSVQIDGSKGNVSKIK